MLSPDTYKLNFMKKNKYSFLSLALVLAGVVFTSCNNDDAKNDSVVNVYDGAASVAAVSPVINVDGLTTINEGGADTELEFSVVLQKVQPVDVYVNVSLVPGGDAVEEEDFDFDHQVIIPAFTTTGKGKVVIHGDAETEGTESFTLQVGDGTEANLSLTPKELMFNITDFGDLNLELTWDRTFNFGGTDYTLCQIGYDVDFYVFDSEGNDVTDYQAATGACPEYITLSLANLPDGEYELIENIYDDSGLSTAGIDPAFDIPVTVNYARDNSPFAGTFVQDDADVIDSNFGSDPAMGTPIYVATITVSNGLFTFSKNGSVVATGKMAKIQKVLKNRNKTARAKYFRG